MESANLGELRLARELALRLGAYVTKFHQDRMLGDFEDNGTRMRATELLADFHGKRKSEVNVSGKIEFPTAADMSPAERLKWLEDHIDALGKLLEARGWKRPDAQPT